MKLFKKRNSDIAIIKIDNITKEAKEMGWTDKELYRSESKFRFPFGEEWGLVCYMDQGDKIENVQKYWITIRSKTGSITKFYKKKYSLGKELTQDSD